MRHILIIAALFCSLPQIFAQNNITYGAGISYTNGAPSFVPPARTSRVAIDTITGKWYHFNTPGGWQLLGNTIEEIAGCSAPAYTPTKGDSKIVINNCTAPELYYWTGSAWVWINEGTTYYAGEGIRIQNDSIILDSLYTLRFRTGSSTDGEAGRLTWDANEGTIDVVLNAGNVTGQMFEDVFFNCRNQTGTQITRGTVVMAVGTQGASGRILIAPAIANGTVNSEYILGTAAMDIANDSDGLVYHFGKDRGLNTTGTSCGETWADRDILYCSATTAGCLTKTIPTAPNLKVPIAFVIRAGNNGTLFVRPSHFPDLNQINDVQLTSPTTGQTLIYNSVTGVWSNQTPADPSSTNELQTLSTGTNTLTLSNGGGTVTVDTDPASDVTGSGASGQVSFWTGTQTQSGDNNLWWDNTNKRLGIGTITPSAGISMVNNGGMTISNVDLATAMTIQSTNNIPSVTLRSNNTSTPYGFNFGTLTQGRFRFAYAQDINRFFIQGADVNGDYTSTASITVNRVTNNNVGINISQSSSPGSTLTVNGNTYIGGNALAAATLHVRSSGSTSSTWTAQFHNSATGGNNALMIRDDGNVGIGTSTPTSKLTVSGRIEPVSIGNSVFVGKDAGIVDDLTDNRNIFIGFEAGFSNTSGANNLFMGYQAGRVTTGTSNNFFLGNLSGLNNTGSNNVFIGYQTGQNNTTGTSNIFIGTNAGFSNTTASENVNIGFQAGVLSTTGSNNVNIGYHAGRNNLTQSKNTNIGSYSGVDNKGLNNTIIGAFAGNAQRNSSNNVFVGSDAGRYIISGAADTLETGSIFIGSDSRSLNYSQINQIVIGTGGRGLGSNTTRIGNSSTTQTHLDGSLTLGDATLEASAVLDISSTTRGVLFPRMTTTQRDLIATPADGLVIYNTTDNKLQVRAAGVWVDLH